MTMQNAGEMPKDQIFKMRLEDEDRKRLDSLAEQWSSSAADVVRQLIRQESEKALATQYRVSAWDGSKTTCLFWFGPDKDLAIAKAKDFATTHAAEKWTVFRVFGSDQSEPIYRALVTRKKPSK